MPATLSREAAIAALDREIAARSFSDPDGGFLNYVYVRPDSDDDDTGLFDDADTNEHGAKRKFERWPHLIERAEAWERGDGEVILKARQLGLSWLVAAYTLWRGLYWPGDIALISKGEREAKKQLKRSAFVYSQLPDHFRTHAPARFATEEATFHNTNTMLALPSTEDIGVSYTFRRVVMDEEGFHPYAKGNFGALEPTMSAGGQFLGLSTANPRLGPNGFFHDQYWGSKAGKTGYRAVFIPWYARPERDAAWLSERRGHFTGLSEEFDAYYPATDAQAFVARSGLVYPQFDTNVHVWVPREGHEDPWHWWDSVRRVAGVDFGGGDPTAVTMLGMSGKHHLHQFGEFYRRGAVGIAEIAGYIAGWDGPGIAVCDPSEPVAIETLNQALRGTGWTAQAADNRRGVGLGFVGWLLDENRLSIDAGCLDSIAEFPGYRWATRTDPNDKNRYATSTPVDNHADGMDARRYAVMELLALLRPMAVMPRRAYNTGRPLSTRAV